MAREITAAGAVVWRHGVPGSSGSGAEIAVVHRARYDDWSLPKGKLERGESTRLAAVREVAEETGFRVTLGRRLGRVRYPVTHPEPATKVVDYYAARAGEGCFVPGDEVDELRWLEPGQALELLSYPHDERIVSAFTGLPHDTKPLLLVRHAKAGSRSGWDGPDAQRPLSANGRQQLGPIAVLAELYGASRVHSAPLVRCVDTVRDMAERRGVPVVAEPLLSEEGYAGHEEAAVARLLSIAAEGGAPIVCSQGGVIPDLVSRVAGAAGVPLGEVMSKKGSVWILSFTPGPSPRLVAADYVPKP